MTRAGTGKTYASAFAMRELGFKRVLFIVHRGQLARQTKRSYERVFSKTVSMGLVGAGQHEYDADYIFATVQTLNKDEHLLRFEPDAFEAIILDEAHHVSAQTYQKVMNHFTPKLWLGMTATPDKRDDNIEGRNIYELFNYQIAYEIRLQQAMEEDLLCPFHYFGVTDISIVGDDEEGRSIQSEDVMNFLNAKERGITVELFVRKNKDDKISKEFYYLGHMAASGRAKEFTMPNTNKTAVEIEWILDEPIREDIYEYIIG